MREIGRRRTWQPRGLPRPTASGVSGGDCYGLSMRVNWLVATTLGAVACAGPIDAQSSGDEAGSSAAPTGASDDAASESAIADGGSQQNPVVLTSSSSQQNPRVASDAASSQNNAWATTDGAVCDANERACPVWVGCGTTDGTACFHEPQCPPPPECPPR